MLSAFWEVVKFVMNSTECRERPDFASDSGFTFFLFTLSVRYKNVERLAAEEFEKERVRVSRTRPDLNLTFTPSEAWPSSSRSSTPSSFASQEDTEADLEADAPATPYTPSETGRATNTYYS